MGRARRLNVFCGSLFFGFPDVERSLVSSQSRANLELILVEAEAEARASACGSPETMDGQPVYDDVSEGDALLPTDHQTRRKRLRPAVGAAVGS